MRLKLFRAASVTQAMALVRTELGPDALILSTRRTGQGVELTAALQPEEDPPLARCDDIAHALRFHGVPATIAARLEGRDLASRLAALLRFEALPLAGAAPPVLLAGVPGAGKTLSVARLATRMVLAGTAPMLITTDGRRAGAAEEIAAFTRLLGIGLVAAATPAALARALQARMPGTPVLIDTPGLNPFAASDMQALRALAAASGGTVVLVAASGMDATEAGEQAACFAEEGARFLLPTRLDLARRLGSLLASAVCGRLAIGEAGTGPGATDSLETLTADGVARRLTRHGARLVPSDQPREATHAKS